MIKVGIFGDSYADPIRHGHDNFRELDDIGWPNLLRNKYEVGLHAEPGSSIYYSYQEFLKHHEKYDKSNPLALNMYLLGYDVNKNLVGLNKAVKQNLKIYLSQYRIMTDAINIKDGYIINISVKFNIIVKRGYNKNDVLFKAIQTVKQFFAPDKWQMNQPIVLSDLAYQISLVDGVVSLVAPEINNPNRDLILIENKHSIQNGYSGNVYDIGSASQEGIVYPSLDPSIFELKFPNSDIEGKVVGDR